MIIVYDMFQPVAEKLYMAVTPAASHDDLMFRLAIQEGHLAHLLEYLVLSPL